MQERISINQTLDINKLRDDLAGSNKKIFLANEKLKRITERTAELDRYYDENISSSFEVGFIY